MSGPAVTDIPESVYEAGWHAYMVTSTVSDDKPAVDAAVAAAIAEYERTAPHDRAYCDVVAERDRANMALRTVEEAHQRALDDRDKAEAALAEAKQWAKELDGQELERRPGMGHRGKPHDPPPIGEQTVTPQTTIELAEVTLTLRLASADRMYREMRDRYEAACETAKEQRIRADIAEVKLHAIWKAVNGAP